MSRLEQFRTLLLDSGCRPVGTLSWQRAIVLDWQDRVDVLDYYDQEVRTAHDAFPLPAVARVRQYLKYLSWRMPFSRRALFLRDGYTCQYCGDQPAQRLLTLDHVLPSSRGGDTSWTNIVAACSPCNRRKADRTPREAGMPLLRAPIQPKSLPRRRGVVGSGKVPAQWEEWLAAG